MIALSLADRHSTTVVSAANWPTRKATAAHAVVAQ
jgi:hypothetical protein